MAEATVRGAMMKPIREYIRRDENVWQIYCGESNPYSKYQEEYKVLGNKNRPEIAAYLFNSVRDRSYEANAGAVSRVIMGLSVE